jgi:hypothetical protein
VEKRATYSSQRHLAIQRRFKKKRRKKRVMSEGTLSVDVAKVRSLWGALA